MAFRPPQLSTFVTAVITGLLTAGSLLIVGNATIYGDATVRSLTATSTAVGLSVAGRAQIDGNVTTTVGLTPATANTGSIGTSAYPFGEIYSSSTVASARVAVLKNSSATDVAVSVGTTNGKNGLASSDNDSVQIIANNASSLSLTTSAVIFQSGVTPRPVISNSVDLGSSSFIFRNAYVSSTLLQDGLVNLPTYTFANDTDTGLYRFAANSVGISAGGAVAAYFQSGKVFVKGSYATLADGDGYYFGDNVRGLRYITGDDFEFVQWHVGGQRYEAVFNGSVYTRYVVFDAPTKRSAFSSSVDLHNYTPNTDLEVIGTASSSLVILGTDGTGSVPALRFGSDSDTGLWRDGSNALAFAAGGASAYWTQTAFYAATDNARDIGTTSKGWRDAYFVGTVSTTNIIASGNGTFRGQVSSTSLIVSATGTIRELNVGNAHDGTFGQALLSLKHSPTQTEVNNLATFATLWNTSSTLPTEFVFMNDDGTQYLGSITAFGRNYPVDGDFGFSFANMMFYESTSGTVMTAGDAAVVISASGALRPLTGLGFGNNDNIDPFGAMASTTITNGNMGSASLDFPNSAAAGTQDLTITVNGATDGDECQLGVPNALASRASEAFTCFVSTANTITVRRTCVAAIGCGDPGAATVKAGFFSRQ